MGSHPHLHYLHRLLCDLEELSAPSFVLSVHVCPVEDLQTGRTGPCLQDNAFAHVVNSELQEYEVPGVSVEWQPRLVLGVA